MTRSAEALKRRAEKRNLSLKDMKDIEANKLKKMKRERERDTDKEEKEKKENKTKQTTNPSPKKKQRVEKTHSPPPTISTTQIPVKSIQLTPVTESKSSGERWICSACNNSNLTRYSQTVCNRCQRLRSEVEKQIENTTTYEEKQEIESSPAAVVSANKPKSQKKRRRSNSKEIPAPIWTCGIASQEKLDENMRLRNLYNNLETRDQLTPEELERAKILVDRSERKKQKKQLAKSSGRYID